MFDQERKRKKNIAIPERPIHKPEKVEIPDISKTVAKVDEVLQSAPRDRYEAIKALFRALLGDDCGCFEDE